MRDRAALSALLAVLLAACKGPEHPSTVEPDAQDAGEGEPDASPADEARDASAPLPDPAACVRRVFERGELPLELAILADRTTASWASSFPARDIVSEALVAFADTARLSRLSIALQTMPSATAETLCDDESYVLPLVPMEPAPEVSATIKAALASIGILNVAAARPAFVGMREYMRLRADAEPFIDRAMVIMQGYFGPYCDSTPEGMAPLFSEARDATPPLRTYLIVEGDTVDSWANGLAAAGGSDRVFGIDHVETGLLVAALERVRRDSAACRLPFPVLADARIEPDSLTLQLELGDGRGDIALHLRDGPAACRGGVDGFYYEEPKRRESPLALCPASCAIARAEEKSRITLEAECVVLLR